jgi:hypothetical protein
MIEKDSEVSVAKQCELLELARSSPSFYSSDKPGGKKHVGDSVQ